MMIDEPARTSRPVNALVSRVEKDTLSEGGEGKERRDREEEATMETVARAMKAGGRR